MSITLTDAISVSQGATIVETDAAAAAMDITMDFQLANPALMINLKTGNVSGNSLVPGNIAADQIQISIDLTSGRWSATNGLSGTVGAGVLTGLVNTLKNFRNSAESFAVNQGVVAGTQVSW